MKQIGKNRNKEKTNTDGNKKRNGEKTVMARRRYVFNVTKPLVNEETVEVFKFMSQTMGFSAITSSQDGDGYELRQVPQDAAKLKPTEKEQMTHGGFQR